MKVWKAGLTLRTRSCIKTGSQRKHEYPTGEKKIEIARIPLKWPKWPRDGSTAENVGVVRLFSLGKKLFASAAVGQKERTAQKPEWSDIKKKGGETTRERDKWDCAWDSDGSRWDTRQTDISRDKSTYNGGAQAKRAKISKNECETKKLV